MKPLRSIEAVLFAAIIGGVGLAMTQHEQARAENTEELLIESAPIAPQDALSTLEIVSKQGHLGGGGEVAVTEGHLTVGTPVLYKQAIAATDGAELVTRRGELCYLLKFPFTLHPLPERQCKKLIFRVTVTSPNATALKLIPDVVATSTEISRSEDIGFSVNIPVADVKGDAKTTRLLKYAVVTPTIKSYGLGEKKFYWVFEGQNGGPVEDGSKTVAVTLKVPKDSTTMKITLGWELDWQRRTFDIFRSVPVTVKEQTVDVDLTR